MAEGVNRGVDAFHDQDQVVGERVGLLAHGVGSLSASLGQANDRTSDRPGSDAGWPTSVLGSTWERDLQARRPL
jgi:hypothetical protein